MSARARIRGTVLAGLFVLLAAGRADAQQTCMTDLDCPNDACGGDVCTKSSGAAACTPADAQGESGRNDGWCAGPDGNADNSKCKCRGMGATCNGFYCTFTIPPTDGGGGSTGSAGTSGGTTGSSGGGGCSIAGPAATGGAAGIALMVAALKRRRARRRT
jgi:hypothetical protein